MPELVVRQKKTDTAVDLIERLKPEMARALPRFLTAERMARVCLTSIRRTPKLLDCDQQSLAGALMTAAQLGLEPDGVTGMAYLIPYGREATFVPGYRGLLALAWRSGQLASVTCEVVREKDQWLYEQGIELKLRHVPYEGEDEPGALRFAYCILRLKDGGVITAVMNKRQIEAVRKASRSGASGPWQTHTEEMWRKTVLKRCLKLAPLSIEVQQAVTEDEMAEAGVERRNDAEVLEVREPCSTSSSTPSPSLPSSSGSDGDAGDSDDGPPLTVEGATTKPAAVDEKSLRQKLVLKLKALGIETDDDRHAFLNASYGYEKGLSGLDMAELQKLSDHLKTKDGAEDVTGWIRQRKETHDA